MDLFSTRRFPHVLVIDFKPRTLDENNAAALAENLYEVVQENTARRLYLNFASVRRVAEHVWQELIDLNDFLQEGGQRLGLLNLTPSLSQQLRDAEASQLQATCEMEIAS